MADTLGDNSELAAVFARAKEKIQLSEEGHRDRDWAAQQVVRAWRDGVPPSRVRDYTVDCRAAVRLLTEAVAGATRGQSSRPIGLRVPAGMGQTHVLRYASELANAAGVAVAWVPSVDGRPSVLKTQQVLLAGARVDGQTLAAYLAGSTGRSGASASVSDVRRLLNELSPGGVISMTLVLEAASRGRYEEALEVLSWLLGETVDEAWRRARHLPLKPELAPTGRGVLAGCVAFARIVGASGLVVIDDARPDPGHEGTVPGYLLDPLPGLLVLSGQAWSGVRGMIELGPLKREELEALARLIRDQHVRAYEWPAADEVIDSRLGSLTRALNGDKTREWVRGVVAALDSTLAEQSGK